MMLFCITMLDCHACCDCRARNECCKTTQLCCQDLQTCCVNAEHVAVCTVLFIVVCQNVMYWKLGNCQFSCTTSTGKGPFSIPLYMHFAQLDDWQTTVCFVPRWLCVGWTLNNRVLLCCMNGKPDATCPPHHCGPNLCKTTLLPSKMFSAYCCNKSCQATNHPTGGPLPLGPERALGQIWSNIINKQKLRHVQCFSCSLHCPCSLAGSTQGCW